MGHFDKGFSGSWQGKSWGDFQQGEKHEGFGLDVGMRKDENFGVYHAVFPEDQIHVQRPGVVTVPGPYASLAFLKPAGPLPDGLRLLVRLHRRHDVAEKRLV